MERLSDNRKNVSERNIGEWDMFDLITSAYYGKGMYFQESDGVVYSRYSRKHMRMNDAIVEFISLISGEDAAGESGRKKGRWLVEEYPDGYYHSVCSECGEEFAEDLYWHKKACFCPCCGAYMWGEEDDV